jgi:starch synthase
VVVSSEVAPFSKSGGLGDVCGAIPAALTRRGHQVVTVSPRYGSIDLQAHQITDTGARFGVHTGSGRHDVAILRADRDGVPHLFVEHPMFSGRRGLYGDERGTFKDNLLRFALLSRVALEVPRRVPVSDGAPLGEQVVFHANDWHAALVPVLLESVYRPLGLYAQAPSVLTVHNLAHQGVFPGNEFASLDLAPRWFSPTCLEWYGNLNLLKAGLLTAEELTTVSPTFAREIMTESGGFGLDAILRIRNDRMTGILNGIDPTEWNPATDPHLDRRYDVTDFVAGKAQNKRALQAELGLPRDDVPLVGSVGRLDPQKGIELIIESVPWLAEQGVQFVLLGSAAPAHARYEHALRELERRYPNNVRAWIGFSERVAHRIEAAADLFLMPSKFEPSGLNQLYSMRYGTVPVVRSTGGLADSVTPLDPQHDHGTGFRFEAFDGAAMRDALYRALWTWKHQKERFLRAAERGMRKDVSWDTAVAGYERVYQRASQRRGGL